MTSRLYILMIAFLIFAYHDLQAQARLVLNDDVYLVIDNGAYLVIDNGATNALSTDGTGGNIISEDETDRIKWNIGTTTGTYNIPFTDSPANKIPLSVNITTGGTGSGSILFSTYDGATWDNDTYRPSDVTDMQGGIPIGNNSANVVDRFWIIDAVNYTAKPTVAITFTYLDAEWSAAGNTITEADLFAQRFNSTAGDWGDWLGTFGTANTVANTVTTGAVTPANFFRSWVLVDQDVPLPIDLLFFDAELVNEMNADVKVKLTWETLSEINNDYFVVERSNDLVHVHEILTVPGAGNSLVSINYIDYDIKPLSGVSYYRLKQVDYDGSYLYSDWVPVNINSIDNVVIYPNPAINSLYLSLKSEGEDNIVISVVDQLGQEVIQKEYRVAQGVNNLALDISHLGSATYILKLQTETKDLQIQKQFVKK